MSCMVTGYDNKSMPVYCHGNGACLSLKDMAIYALNSQGESLQLEYTTPWDAQIVRGCSCFRLESIDNQVNYLYIDINACSCMWDILTDIYIQTYNLFLHFSILLDISFLRT